MMVIQFVYKQDYSKVIKYYYFILDVSTGRYQTLDIAIYPQVYIDIDWYIAIFTLKVSLRREENK